MPVEKNEFTLQPYIILKIEAILALKKIVCMFPVIFLSDLELRKIIRYSIFIQYLIGIGKQHPTKFGQNAAAFFHPCCISAV